MDSSLCGGRPSIMGLYLDEDMAIGRQEEIYGLETSDWNFSGDLEKVTIRTMYIQ